MFQSGSILKDGLKTIISRQHLRSKVLVDIPSSATG